MNKNFARYSILSALLFLIGTLSEVNALPVGRSNLSREYLVSPQDLSAWSIGLSAVKLERDVTLKTYGSGLPMKSTKTMGYVGYDVLPWVTFYAVGGGAQTRIGWFNNSSSGAEYGFGVTLNLIDTEIEDATAFENRLRLSSHLQFTRGSAGMNGVYGLSEITWDDFSGDLTLSVVNDLEGDKFFVPNSIALFFGPTFSVLSSTSIEQDKIFGLTAGLDIFLNEKVNLELAYTKFDAGTYSIGVNVRF